MLRRDPHLDLTSLSHQVYSVRCFSVVQVSKPEAMANELRCLSFNVSDVHSSLEGLCDILESSTY